MTSMGSTVEMILAGLRDAAGFDLTGYRRGTLERRLAARIAKLGLSSPEEYAQLLLADPGEYSRLGDALVVLVSSFFRDPIVFEILVQSVLPQVIDAKRSIGVNSLRIWCAGCATGEEAYSTAISICEVLKEEISGWTPYVFATDVSGEAIETAEAGIYPRDKLETTKLGILDRYFLRRGALFEVQPRIRSMVHFSCENLLSKERFAPVCSVFGTFDIVFCRNVLIYLSESYQNRVLFNLSKSLVKDGFLILGSAEFLSKELQREFASVDRKYRIFRKI